MKLFKRMKDGGPESTVVGYWLFEIKQLASVCVLNFQGKSREAYHNHAFNCVSWVIRGKLRETMLDGRQRYYTPSLVPFITRREDFHKVDSLTEDSWILTLRGPWAKRWEEYRPEEKRFVSLSNGRVEEEV